MSSTALAWAATADEATRSGALRHLFPPVRLTQALSAAPFRPHAILRYRSLVPVAQVARDPVRRIGYTSFRGYYRSLTMGLRFPFESLLERDALLVHDFLPTVRRFCSQPRTLIYRREGRRRRYTPDILVEPVAAPPFYLEVRPAERTPGRLAPLEDHIRAAAAEDGCGFEFIDETSIRAQPFYGNCRRARMAARSLTDAALIAAAEALVRVGLPAELGDLCAVMEDEASALDILMGLVGVGILSMPLHQSIEFWTPVWKGPAW